MRGAGRRLGKCQEELHQMDMWMDQLWEGKEQEYPYPDKAYHKHSCVFDTSLAENSFFILQFRGSFFFLNSKLNFVQLCKIIPVGGQRFGAKIIHVCACVKYEIVRNLKQTNLHRTLILLPLHLKMTMICRESFWGALL